MAESRCSSGYYGNNRGNLLDLTKYFNYNYNDSSIELGNDLVLGSGYCEDIKKIWFISPTKLSTSTAKLTNLINNINMCYIPDNKHRIMKLADYHNYEFQNNADFCLKVREMYYSEFRKNIWIDIEIKLNSNFCYKNLYNLIANYVNKYKKTENIIIFNLGYYYINLEDLNEIGDENLHNMTEISLIDDIYNDLVNNNYKKFELKFIRWK